MLLIRASEIYPYSRPETFAPFRIHFSDGASYDVHQPEMIMVTHLEVTVAVELGEGNLPKRTVHCDPRHVTRIERLEQTQRS